MTPRYMLDTNVVSHIMQGRDAGLLTRLAQTPVGQVCISSITLAELEYGLHRRGSPVRLKKTMTEFLVRVDVLSWDDTVARCYGTLCSALESQGINLCDFDMMIAAHAVAANAILVSRDKAFAHIPPPFRLDNW